MTFAWALRLARQDAGTAASLRLMPGIEIAESSDSVWVRGPAGGEQQARALQALPALERFEWLAPGTLRPVASRIAAGAFPSLDWQPIAGWSRTELPRVDTPTADVQQRVSLRLVRCAGEQTANVLLTKLALWLEFALHAPEIRLRPLRFAASSGGDVVIWGTPAPSMPGRRYVEQKGIAIPAGFCWAPRVSSEVLRQLFQVGEDALVLWHEDGSMRPLHPEQLVPASRSGIRATFARLAV